MLIGPCLPRCASRPDVTISLFIDTTLHKNTFPSLDELKCILSNEGFVHNKNTNILI